MLRASKTDCDGSLPTASVLTMLPSRGSAFDTVLVPVVGHPDMPSGEADTARSIFHIIRSQDGSTAGPQLLQAAFIEIRDPDVFLPPLPDGAHTHTYTVTVVYSGDGNYLPVSLSIRYSSYSSKARARLSRPQIIARVNIEPGETRLYISSPDQLGKPLCTYSEKS